MIIKPIVFFLILTLNAIIPADGFLQRFLTTVHGFLHSVYTGVITRWAHPVSVARDAAWGASGLITGPSAVTVGSSRAVGDVARSAFPTCIAVTPHGLSITVATVTALNISDGVTRATCIEFLQI